MVEGKVMFQVYRDVTYNGDYHVVYFTELNEHNKDTEIDHALAGEAFLDGYLKESTKKEAKQVIAHALKRLNEGEAVTPEELREALAPHLA
jgi:hypothetical protein